MMKILAFLISSLAFGGTIPVTGFGSFSLDNLYDTYANVCLFGSGISACNTDVPIGPAAPVELSQLTDMDVSGEIEITSFKQFETRWTSPGVLNDDWWASGTFNVVQTPETSTLSMIGMSLILFGLYDRCYRLWDRKRCRRRE